MDPWTIPLSVMIISLGTLVFAGMGLWRAAKQSQVDQLQARVVTLETKLAECERQRTILQEEVLMLMKKLVVLDQLTLAKGVISGSS